MESILKIIFLLLTLNFKNNSAESLSRIVEERFENILCEYTNYMAKCLEDYNDRHLGKSDIGKMIKYDVLKSKFGATKQNSLAQGKNMKKMTMALIPLVFHMGAASTWILLTGILAAKSVAIGLALLVFKIAVSSAKVASFFTSLKTKQDHGHHHDYSWASQYDHHGHKRSLPHKGYHPTDWNYYPELESSPYKSIPSFKSHDHEEYTEETKKVPVRS